MERNENGKFICQYNMACECSVPDCDNCGWNPEVAARRLKNYKEAHKVSEKKYKIPFSGYCEVYAKSEEDALKKADDNDLFYVDYDFGDPVSDEEDDEYELD